MLYIGSRQHNTKATAPAIFVQSNLHKLTPRLPELQLHSVIYIDTQILPSDINKRNELNNQLPVLSALHLLSSKLFFLVQRMINLPSVGRAPGAAAS